MANYISAVHKNPDSRLASHNAGRGGWTKNGRPWSRIHLEEFDNKSAALSREKYLKSGWGRKWLQKNVLCKLETDKIE
jgi:putative endonuclease